MPLRPVVSLAFRSSDILHTPDDEHVRPTQVRGVYTPRNTLRSSRRDKGVVRVGIVLLEERRINLMVHEREYLLHLARLEVKCDVGSNPERVCHGGILPPHIALKLWRARLPSGGTTWVRLQPLGHLCGVNR